MVGCFLTPSTNKPYTYPATVAEEIRAQVGEYQVDVPHFRTDDKDYLLKQVYEMTEKRFWLIKHWMKNRPWDFFHVRRDRGGPDPPRDVEVPRSDPSQA